MFFPFSLYLLFFFFAPSLCILFVKKIVHMKGFSLYPVSLFSLNVIELNLSFIFSSLSRTESAPRETNSMLYHDFLKVLLDFQLQGHERFLGKFVRLFRQYDADKNGILNEAEFVQLLRAIDPAKTDHEVNALLDLIDPHDNQLINFSECVTFLSSELVKMMSEMKQQQQTVE